jgi:hypothetical protein
MNDRPEENVEEAAAAESQLGGNQVEEQSVTHAGISRTRRSWGFVASWTFWFRLGISVLMVGIGVLIGLGIAWFVDEDQRSDRWDGHQQRPFTLEVDPAWDGFSDGGVGRGGPWFRSFPGHPGSFGWELIPGWKDLPGRGNGFAGDDRGRWKGGAWEDGEWEGWGPSREKFSREGLFKEEGFVIPHEVLDRVEGMLDRVERLIYKMLELSEQKRSDNDKEWPGFFGDEDSGGVDWPWRDDNDRDGQSYDDYQEGTAENSPGTGGDWPWGEGSGLFPGSGFPFAQLIPGLSLLEDCELDFESLLGILEDSAALGGSEPEGEEDFDEFFEEIGRMLNEACEEPPDS